MGNKIFRNGFSRAESRDSAALFRVRSGSLDSISTAISFGTQNGLTRYNSADNLCHQQDHVCQSKTEDGKQYTLVDTDSLSSSMTEGERKGLTQSLPKEGEEKGLTQSLPTEREEKGLTQSLPATIEKRVSLPAEALRARPKSEPDGFSDDFVCRDASVADKDMDGRKLDREREARKAGKGASLPRKPSLKRTQHTQAVEEESHGNDHNFPELPQALVEKLSQEEWGELVTYVCDSLGHSLRSSYQDKLSQAQTESRDKATTKHVRISEVDLARVESHGECLECSGLAKGEERMQRRKRRSRKERPTSLPPLYLKHEASLALSTTKEEGNHTCEVDPEDSCQIPEMRGRSRSHDDCSQHSCTEPVELGPHTCRRNCDCRVHRYHLDHHYPCSSRSRKKKMVKSKERDRDAPVDVSLDDNCPGVHRVRRRNYHHHHHHAVCERCLESLGDFASAGKHRHRHKHHSPGQGEDEGGERVNRTEYLTLEKLKAAALILQRSMGQEDQEAAYPLRHSDSFSHKRHAKLRNRHSYHQDYMSSRSADVQELIFPVRSRTGRDSPATDMAVVNLDFDSPHMLEPIDRERQLWHSPLYTASDSRLNNSPGVPGTDSTPVRHLYLHNHHHYYIIHHSQP